VSTFSLLRGSIVENISTPLPVTLKPYICCSFKPLWSQPSHGASHICRGQKVVMC
jgi:hypothetical protein